MLNFIKFCFHILLPIFFFFFANIAYYVNKTKEDNDTTIKPNIILYFLCYANIVKPVQGQEKKHSFEGLHKYQP